MNSSIDGTCPMSDMPAKLAAEYESMEFFTNVQLNENEAVMLMDYRERCLRGLPGDITEFQGPRNNIMSCLSAASAAVGKIRKMHEDLAAKKAAAAKKTAARRKASADKRKPTKAAKAKTKSAPAPEPTEAPVAT